LEKISLHPTEREGSVFQGFQGFLDAAGKGKAFINLPGIPGLKGFRIYVSFLTLDARAPFGVQSIAAARSFLIQ